MYVSRKAIERPRVVIVGVLLVAVIALMAAFDIPVQRTPAINTAVILVQVVYPGAQPNEVEEQITRKIEEALERLNDVDFVASTSMRGVSVTQVIFLDGVEAKRARDDVAHLVDEVRSQLPLGREVQPIITHIDFESSPIMLVNMSGPPGFDERTLKEIAEDVQDELEAISGVSNTQLFGGREREIHVNVNPDLFFQYGLEIGQIRQALVSHHAELPGGSFNTSEFDFQIRNETKFRDLDDVG
jgi:multidrug efflux pump subunit AcrB